MFFRVKGNGGREYLQIAESYRDGERVRQRIVATLGRLDVLQASGQLERLLRSGLRFSKRLRVLDAHAAGETKPVSITKIGPDLVFGRLWVELGFGEIIDEMLGQRRYEFKVERAVYLTVLHRLFASGSDRAAERWRECYRIPGTEDLALQHLSLTFSGAGSFACWRSGVTLPHPELRPHAFDDGQDIVCLNEEERRKDARDRATILEALREQLRRGDKSLVGNKGYRRFLKIEGGGHFTIDDKQVAQEESYDGLFVLRTDTEHDTETVARVYKMLWMVEDTFRTAKSILETRPIYHKSDEAIRGHIFCSFLALVLKRELEIRMEDKGLSWEWAEILRGLDNLQEVEAEFQGHRFVMRGRVIGNAMQAIRGVGAALPPTIRETS